MWEYLFEKAKQVRAIDSVSNHRYFIFLLPLLEAEPLTSHAHFPVPVLEPNCPGAEANFVLRPVPVVSQFPTVSSTRFTALDSAPSSASSSSSSSSTGNRAESPLTTAGAQSRSRNETCMKSKASSVSQPVLLPVRGSAPLQSLRGGIDGYLRGQEI